MKIRTVGAGAIVALVGIQLAGAGHEVTFICRGSQLAAACECGFRLMFDDVKNVELNPVDATDKIAEADPHDLVILAMKAHQVAAVVPRSPSWTTPARGLPPVRPVRS
jgi:2-dehydropantoate 2-reductase